MKDFEKYYGKFVHLLVDGRDYDLVGGKNVHQEGAVAANKSVKIFGRIVDENERFLNLEEVVTLGVFVSSLNKFKSGYINKDYLIGLFESPSD